LHVDELEKNIAPQQTPSTLHAAGNGEKDPEEAPSLTLKNRNYWTWRAASYSEGNRSELAGSLHRRWKEELLSHIARTWRSTADAALHVLDVGTGPGFFAIILAEAGFRVTAIDVTPSMLAEARKNAGPLAEKICFMEMDAQEPAFSAHSFDVVVSRNVTWNLPRPRQAYEAWLRLLKPGGLLLNFDANWYRYLFDEKALQGYCQDRANSARRGVRDPNIGKGYDVMEDIARRVPLSRELRPQWDLDVFRSLGVPAECDTQVWQRVWTDDEKLSFASTPLFLVAAKKPHAR
jgi:ubiquinone/menaquinone biosynthesis C-methylase UbiE